MATISRFFAVAEIGRIRTTGFLAWLLWLAVHLVHVVGFKSRVTTLLHWTVSFLGRARSERTATAQQVFARQALLRQGGPGHDEMPRGGPGPRAGTGPAHG
jgi:NADH dehydrogenase